MPVSNGVIVTLQINLDDWAFALILGREEEQLRIWAPRVATHPAIKPLRQLRTFSRPTLVEHEAEAVALVAGTRLRKVGDVLSVGRVAGGGIGAGGGGDF